MAETTVATNLREEVWDNNYFKEYVRDNLFSPYMGTGPTNAIIVKSELVNRPGDKIHIPLITRLKGTGVTGNQVLEGNEEQLGNYEHGITADWLRNGVVVTVREEKVTGIAIRDAARSMLMTWSMENLRGGSGANANITGIIDAMYAFRSNGVQVLYEDADETTVKDAWLAANADRVLFGAAKGNNASNDHSAALATIDGSADKLSPAIVSLAKRMAKTADPHIRPIRVNGGREYFVMFAGSYSFRDLKEDSTMQQANREARARDVNSNPIFQDGDLIYDGVIIREIPEIPVLSGVGDNGIDVTGNFLCGQQALAVAWGRRPQTRTQTTDYQFRYGVGIQEMRGVEKLFFDDVQHGMVTVYTSAVADA